MIFTMQNQNLIDRQIKFWVKKRGGGLKMLYKSQKIESQIGEGGGGSHNFGTNTQNMHFLFIDGFPQTLFHPLHITKSQFHVCVGFFFILPLSLKKQAFCYSQYLYLTNFQLYQWHLQLTYFFNFQPVKYDQAYIP